MDLRRRPRKFFSIPAALLLGAVSGALVGTLTGMSSSSSAKRKPASICNVMDQHAVGDGKTLDTAAIQATVDSCPAGGVVLLPAGGTFLSGTINLKSNLTFRIEPGARLLGTQDTSAYPDLLPPTTNSQLGNCRKALLYAEGVQNLTIEGGAPATGSAAVNLTAMGTVDGNGANNPAWNGPEATRPMAVFVALSQNITIQYLQVVNSGMWSVVQMENTNVTLQYVRVDSTSGPTRDGIDIVDSTQVLIDHCDVTSEDDSICLKSGSAKGVHQVTVQNSRVRNSGVANALKLGTASSGSFDGIRFVNIQIDSAKQAAMAVESVDGAAIHGVTFKQINFNAGTAAFVLLGQRTGAPQVGSIKNVFFQDITGTVETNWGSAISGTAIGSQVARIQNLSFQNVNIVEANAGGLTSVPPSPPEYAGGYPDPRMPGWQPLPAFGFYFRHVNGVSFSGSSAVTAPAAKSDPRPAVSTADDVSGFVTN